jgi:ATP-binding cassette subfamily F protein 3
MLNLTDVSLRRGPRVLLQDVNLTLHRGQKVGIVGRNGSGKSSLFELVLGHLSTDKGSLTLDSTMTISHVAQELPAGDFTALNYVLDGDSRRSAIMRAIEQAEQSQNAEAVGRHYDELNEIDGYAAPARAAKLLTGLGFTNNQLDYKLDQFSGGWQVRLNLARALMAPADLLLLDEPTNHLDIEAIVWLENFLRQQQSALLLISHDAEFLNNTVSHIVHFEGTQLKLYSGNFEQFERTRAAQLAQQAAMSAKQQTEVGRIKKFVARFGAKASKSKQAQSRLKKLEKFETIVAAHVDSEFKFEFREFDRVADPILSLKDVSLGYDDKVILSQINQIVQGGDRIALLGKNGSGKSTLVKFLAGELNPLDGERTFAQNLRIGYFAQNQLLQLDEQAHPLTLFRRLDGQAREQDIRDFLGGFGFIGERVEQVVGSMSGGEKSRLALALIVYQRPALLLLDEPTNHLDIEMRVALMSALQNYSGGVILVSHDRQLINAVADDFWLIQDGRVAPWLNDLSGYIAALDEPNIVDAETQDAAAKTSINKREQRQAAAQKRQQIQPLKNKLKHIETKMNALSVEQQGILNQLTDSTLYEVEEKAKLTDLLQKRAKLEAELSALEQTWFDLQAELDELASE